MADIRIEKNPERGGYVLRANWVVPERIERVFHYFANAFNLEELTPPWLKFTVTTLPPIVMREGVLIDYKLTLHGIPVGWQSEISAWEPHRRFVDQALRSPYRWWHHEHLFEEVEGGTRVTDIVQYGVPGGALIHFLAVKRDVQRIFDYRQQQLAVVFPNSGPGE